jgi:hypothetical protein
LDVVGHAEFLRCVQTAIRTDGDDRRVDEFLRRLSSEHESVEMREVRLEITSFGILLWATGELRLSDGSYRVTWRYEDRDGQRAIVCFTLAQV